MRMAPERVTSFGIFCAFFALFGAAFADEPARVAIPPAVARKVTTELRARIDELAQVMPVVLLKVTAKCEDEARCKSAASKLMRLNIDVPGVAVTLDRTGLLVAVAPWNDLVFRGLGLVELTQADLPRSAALKFFGPEAKLSGQLARFWPKVEDEQNLSVLLIFDTRAGYEEALMMIPQLAGLTLGDHIFDEAKSQGMAAIQGPKAAVGAAVRLGGVQDARFADGT